MIIFYVQQSFRDAQQSFRDAQQFLNHQCKFIRKIFAFDYTMNRYGSIGLVMEYFPETLKEYLTKNSTRLSPGFIIHACRCLIKAVLYLVSMFI